MMVINDDSKSNEELVKRIEGIFEREKVSVQLTVARSLIDYGNGLDYVSRPEYFRNTK